MKDTFVEDSAIFINSVQGIDYVRPPTLNSVKLKDTEEYTEYKIITKKKCGKKNTVEKRLS